MAMIRDRIARLGEQISSVCRRLGRNPKDITLVAVTKYASRDAVVETIAAGITHIGENRVQEAEKKFVEIFLSSLTLPREQGKEGWGVTKHMIGHLQTNKVKAALELFDMIQSVDSLRLAREIEKQAMRTGRAVDILIEVNTSQEIQKHGIAIKETVPLIEQISVLSHLRILGLMTVGPLTEDKERIHHSFRTLRQLGEGIQKQFMGHPRLDMKYLSMGMSSDYEIALEEGSNMLRIGSAIFKSND